MSVKIRHSFIKNRENGLIHNVDSNTGAYRGFGS